jgi:hypothetical protein
MCSTNSLGLKDLEKSKCPGVKLNQEECNGYNRK